MIEHKKDQMVSLYLIKKIDALDERISRMETGKYHEMIDLIDDIHGMTKWCFDRDAENTYSSSKDFAIAFNMCVDIYEKIAKYKGDM